MSDEEKDAERISSQPFMKKVGMYLEENEREWLKRYTRPI